MSIIVKAIFENGVFKPMEKVEVSESEMVQLSPTLKCGVTPIEKDSLKTDIVKRAKERAMEMAQTMTAEDAWQFYDEASRRLRQALKHQK